MKGRRPASFQEQTVWRRLVAALGPRVLLAGMRFYPPFLGAGIRVVSCDPRIRVLTVGMPLRPWTRNYVGSHFGGSLYAMCDPFFMLIVMENLGPDYSVWDKAATIDFVSPGRGTVSARFEVGEERFEAIRREVAQQGRSQPLFEVTVTDRQGKAVARVTKTLSVRRRKEPQQDGRPPSHRANSKGGEERYE